MNGFLPPAAIFGVADSGVDECAHRFGAGLIGVLARPRVVPVQRTALILFNAGLIQRVGPFRGYVQLARALAARGFPVLRFDQSGRGDSAVSGVASAQAELHAAMALLSGETGADRFVLGGICSAADEAFNRAAEEPRVAGLLLLDGLAYRTAGYWLRHLSTRLLHPRKWLQLLRRFAAEQPGLNDYREFPSRPEAARRLSELVARDVRLLFLYTAGSYGYFNHPSQLAACLGAAARAAQVTLVHWTDCDHTFYLRQDRARLQQAVAAWMQAQFDDGGGIGRNENPA